MNGFFRTTFFVMALLVAPGLAAAAPVDLVAHRAAYEIRLGEQKDSNSGVVDVSGRVVYGLKKTCGGWIMEQDHAMNIHLQNGKAVPDRVQFSSWEADDASRYQYSMSSASSAESGILGNATMGNGGGKAVFQKPESATFALPAGTLFPLAHSRALLAHARNGESQFNATVFEGTGVEAAKLLVAFISPLAEGKWRQLDPLLRVPGWTVRMAYFDPASQASEPLYEVEADFLENGIAPRWLLDYGSFTVEMNIRKIEALPQSGC